MIAPGMSMFEQTMGDGFDRLHGALQRFHRLAGRHRLEGWIEADAPASAPARLLALCLGTPRRAQSGPFQFELDARPQEETWTRYFPSRTMTSRLRLAAGQVVEYLGAARLVFDIHEVGGRLEMRLQRLHFLGIPCPGWLMPRLMAIETGDGDSSHFLHFQIHAALPLVGVVAGYRGHLVIPSEDHV